MFGDMYEHPVVRPGGCYFDANGTRPRSPAVQPIRRAELCSFCDSARDRSCCYEPRVAQRGEHQAMPQCGVRAEVHTVADTTLLVLTRDLAPSQEARAPINVWHPHGGQKCKARAPVNLLVDAYQ